MRLPTEAELLAAREAVIDAAKAWEAEKSRYEDWPYSVLGHCVECDLMLAVEALVKLGKEAGE